MPHICATAYATALFVQQSFEISRGGNFLALTGKDICVARLGGLVSGPFASVFYLLYD